MVRQLTTGAVLALALAGCGGSEDGAQPVTGSVNWSGGDLSGHLVEFAQPSDPTVRGFGTIGPNGQFALERLVAGKTATGLPPGTYQARLILNDEGDGRVKKLKVPARYLDLRTAGCRYRWPAAGDVTLTVGAK